MGVKKVASIIRRIHADGHGPCPSLTSAAAAAAAGSVDCTNTDWRFASRGSLFWFTGSTSETHNGLVNRETVSSVPPNTSFVPLRKMNRPAMTLEETVTQVVGVYSHSPSQLPAEGRPGCSCRGAARGFSLEISRCTLFSRLKFLNRRATRAPMFETMPNTDTDNKVCSKCRR